MPKVEGGSLFKFAPFKEVKSEEKVQKKEETKSEKPEENKSEKLEESKEKEPQKKEIKFTFDVKPLAPKNESPVSDKSEEEKCESPTVVLPATGKLFQKYITELSTLKLSSKSFDSGLVSIEQLSSDLFLILRSFSGQIHFKSFIFPKSSKLKELDKMSVKLLVSVYEDKKY